MSLTIEKAGTSMSYASETESEGLNESVFKLQEQDEEWDELWEIKSTIVRIYSFGFDLF